jgi:hypothetical protein
VKLNEKPKGLKTSTLQKYARAKLNGKPKGSRLRRSKNTRGPKSLRAQDFDPPKICEGEAK